MSELLEAHLRRPLLALADPSKPVRKQALKTLLAAFTGPTLQDPFVAQQVLGQHLKALTSLLYDEADLAREMAAQLLRLLLERSAETKEFLPYLCSVLVERLNCEDLDGIMNMPEVMRPPPGQKPKVVVKLVEKVEEVRLEIAVLLQSMIRLTEKEDLALHLDAVCEMLRALAMDPLGEVQKKACEIIGLLCKTMGDTLLNFTEMLGRAILLPLVSKKSKIKLGALDALNHVLDCGIWKKNAFIMEVLVGYRDPNSIAIKDFFESSLNYNYLATLIIDPNVQVRAGFMRCLYRWVCELVDRYDHHPRLLPYVLSGLIDTDPDIRKTAFRTIEEIGKQMETEKEGEFREAKQYGVDAWWTQGETRLERRPCLGARFFVRGHVRKMWTALYRELRDINEQNRVKAANLVLLGIIYSEEYIVQHLDNLIPNLIPNLINASPEMGELIRSCFYHIGRYCNLSAYAHLFTSALTGLYVAEDDFLKASILSLAEVVRGSRFDPGLLELLALTLPQISGRNAQEAFQLLQGVMTSLANTQEQPSPPSLPSLTKGHDNTLRECFGCLFYELYLHRHLLIALPFTETLQQAIRKGCQPGAWHLLLGQALEMGLFSLDNAVAGTTEFGTVEFKCMMSYWLYFVTTGQEERSRAVAKEGRTMIGEARVPDPVDFLLKVGLVLSQGMPVAQPELAFLAIEALRFLERFEAVRPKTAIQMLDQAEGPTLPYNLVLTQLHLVLKTINLLHREALLSPLAVADFVVVSIALCRKRFKREPEPIGVMVRAHWAILERKEWTFTAEANLSAEGEPVTPEWIDFSLGVVEEAGDKAEPQVVLMAFQVLKRLFSSFPEVKVITTPLPLHYPDYPGLLQKLFRYTLAEKNLEQREKFEELLGVLCVRLRDWFMLEARQAGEKRMLERKALLDNIIRRNS